MVSFRSLAAWPSIQLTASQTFSRWLFGLVVWRKCGIFLVLMKNYFSSFWFSVVSDTSVASDAHSRPTLDRRHCIVLFFGSTSSGVGIKTYSVLPFLIFLVPLLPQPPPLLLPTYLLFSIFTILPTYNKAVYLFLWYIVFCVYSSSSFLYNLFSMTCL